MVDLNTRHGLGEAGGHCVPPHRGMFIRWVREQLLLGSAKPLLYYVLFKSKSEAGLLVGGTTGCPEGQ